MPTCRTHGDLPNEAFAKRSTGYIPPVCKECERQAARESRKRRYHDPSTSGLIRDQNQAWREANATILSDKFKTKYATDTKFREKVLDRVTAYRTDPEAHRLKRERAANYFQRKKSEIYERLKVRQARHPELKLRGVIRSRVWAALKGSKDGASVLDFLPYSLQDLKLHLESKFEDWMTWDNWGPAGIKNTWQIDHIVPQCMFPYINMDSPDFLLCWSLDNLRPLDSVRNFQEGSRKGLLGAAATFEDLLRSIRAVGYLNEPEDLIHVVDRLSQMTADREMLPQPRVGISYLDHRFPHRFRANIPNVRSFAESWDDDLDLLKVVAYLVADGRTPTSKAVATNVKFNSFLPSHFYPSAAAALVNTYAPGGHVVDPFLGWGGRTLGALCAGAVSVCGTDLQAESVDGCGRLVREYSSIRSVDSEFLNADFASYLSSTSRRFDLLMTSPPFMATEDYGVEGHSDVRAWSERIVQPLVRGALRVLKPSGHVAFHGQDRRNMPVLTTLLTAFSVAGFEKISEYRYGKTVGQSVVVMRRS